MSHEPKAAWPPPGGTVTQSGHFAERPDPVEPSGCRFCGVSDRDHMQRWMDGVGWHTWADPTQEQRKERMLALRTTTTTAALDRAQDRED